MGVRGLRSSISLSLALHALFLIACAFLLQQRPTIFPSPNYHWVEVAALPEKSVQKRTDEATRKQIVQSNQGQVVEKAAPDAFLGERTQVVDRQTVSKDRTTVIGQSKKSSTAKKMTETAERSVPRDLAPTLSHLGVPILEQIKRDVARERAEGPGFNSAIEGDAVTAHDYIKGLKEGESTALNTKEYVFFGYYQRIRERLDRAWVPILREKLVRYYRSGRQLASETDYSTKLVVVLNGSGEIVRVQMLSESGARDLDDAAVKAFNRAGPFPNPPKGIVNGEGEIQIPWEFVLRT